MATATIKSGREKRFMGQLSEEEISEEKYQRRNGRWISNETYNADNKEP